MKNIVKWIVPLLLAAVAAGCGTERRSALEAYRSWPKGLSVSLTMPADKLQQVKEAGFGHVEVTLNSLRGKSTEERLAAIERFRADAEAEMTAHEEAGHAVVCVSATFEPIIAAAMERRPIQYAIATRMRVDFQGNYTDEVEGEPIEGPEKVVVLRRLCDELFGADGWELAWAYGDHHSDRAMLAAAKSARIVAKRRWQRSRGGSGGGAR